MPSRRSCFYRCSAILKFGGHWVKLSSEKMAEFSLCLFVECHKKRVKSKQITQIIYTRLFLNVTVILADLSWPIFMAFYLKWPPFGWSKSDLVEAGTWFIMTFMQVATHHSLGKWLPVKLLGCDARWSGFLRCSCWHRGCLDRCGRGHRGFDFAGCGDHFCIEVVTKTVWCWVFAKKSDQRNICIIFLHMNMLNIRQC